MSRALESTVARTILSVWAWIVLGVVIIVWTPLVAITRLVTMPFDKAAYWPGYLFRKLTVVHQKLNPLWHFEVTGSVPDDPRRPYVVVANHESFVDILLISHLPFEMKWLSKSEFFKYPLLGWMMRLSRDIRLERGDKKSGARALQESRQRLDQRVSVMIFPEGTRSKTGELGEFKDGAFRIAIQAGAPILPLAVLGTRDALIKHDWRFGRSEAEVRVLDPIPTVGLTKADVPALRDRTREVIAGALDEMRSRRTAGSAVQSAPLRLLLTLRPKIPAGVLAATAVSTVVFAATPFLVRGIAVDFDVDVGAVGVISTAQLGGFMLTTWGAGRVLRPRRRIMVAAILLGMIANTTSALSPWFSLLVGSRFVSGISLGLIAWIAWTEVFGDSEKVGDVAVIGPIVGTIAAPLIATIIDSSGTDLLFLVLAALHLVPLPFVRETRFVAADRPARRRHRPTRAAAAILGSLSLVTFGGSAVFVYVAVIGQDDVGLSPLVVSLVFSANALAGVPSARFRGPRTLPGLWIAITGVMAVLVGVVHQPVVFWIALPMWGFSFWMGIPGAFSLLAERSRYPDERAGDAQAVMAAGRVVGPLAGGALFAASPAVLGAAGGRAMVTAGLAMLYIEWRIHPEVLGDLIST